MCKNYGSPRLGKYSFISPVIVHLVAKLSRICACFGLLDEFIALLEADNGITIAVDFSIVTRRA
jgi:hypothetical protein